MQKPEKRKTLSVAPAVIRHKIDTVWLTPMRLLYSYFYKALYLYTRKVYLKYSIYPPPYFELKIAGNHSARQTQHTNIVLW